MSKSNYVKPALIGAALVSCALAGAGVRSLPAQAAPPSGATDQAAPSSGPPGRYQLQNINETPYLLDTETGRVWVKQTTLTIPAKRYNTITSEGRTVKIPIPESAWVEDSPPWAKPR